MNAGCVKTEKKINQSIALLAGEGRRYGTCCRLTGVLMQCLFVFLREKDLRNEGAGTRKSTLTQRQTCILKKKKKINSVLFRRSFTKLLLLYLEF